MAGKVISRFQSGSGIHLISSTFYGTCDTAADVAVKQVEINDEHVTELKLIPGMLLSIKFTNGNTVTNPQLEILDSTNNVLKNAISIAPNTLTWGAGNVLLFIYDNNNNNEQWISNYLSLSGGTLTGDLKAPKIRSGNTVYGVSKYIYGNTAKETIIYTGIKYVSNYHMPIVHMSGYAYGAGKTTELHIAMYIYNGEFYDSSTVTNLGAWAPDVYLFTYTQNSTEYVAIGLSGKIYYNMMNIDVQDEKTNFDNIDLDNWNISGYTTTGNIPEIGTNHCKKLKYGIDILDRLPLTGGTLTGKLISKENNLDITSTPASNVYNGAIDFVDTNGKQFGNITRVSQWDGYHGISIGIYDSTLDVSNGVSFLLDSQGNKKINVNDAAAWITGLGFSVVVHTPTLNSNATATTFETRRQGSVVNLQVYQLKVAASLADGSSISLGSAIIGSNARPAHNVYMPLIANVSGKGAGCFLYITTGGNVTLYNRSGSALGTSTNLSGNTSWVV